MKQPSALTLHRRDIQRNLQGFATLLRVLTKTFLLDDPSQFNIRSENIKRASDNLHSSFTSVSGGRVSVLLVRLTPLSSSRRIWPRPSSRRRSTGACAARSTTTCASSMP